MQGRKGRGAPGILGNSRRDKGPPADVRTHEPRGWLCVFGTVPLRPPGAVPGGLSRGAGTVLAHHGGQIFEGTITDLVICIPFVW